MAGSSTKGGYERPCDRPCDARAVGRNDPDLKQKRQFSLSIMPEDCSTPPVEYQVIVVGAGCAGASTAYHLAQLGVRTLVLERGDVGKGSDGWMSVSTTNLRGSDESSFMPNVSGTKCLVNTQSPTVKMTITLFSATCEEFISHHGERGARHYLSMASQGLALQKTLGHTLFPSDEVHFRLLELGSLYSSNEKNLELLRREYNFLTRLMPNAKDQIEWWDQTKMEKEHGKDSGFVAGIYFKEDAMIDSSKYAELLLENATSTGMVELRTRCSPVERTETRVLNGALCGAVYLNDGTVHHADHVVLATGGLYFDDIAGRIIRPCWSYLSAIPTSEVDHNQFSDGSRSSCNVAVKTNTMNYFTFNSTHDWCVSNNQLRVSGEDHYSALKPPKRTERCNNLDDWIFKKYPFLRHDNEDHQRFHQYGVYSETPDKMPIVGTIDDHSRVFYITGCNAAGQSILSFAASKIPGMLGYADLTSRDKKLMHSLSIRRFSVLTGIPYRYVSTPMDTRWGEEHSRCRSSTGGSSIISEDETMKIGSSAGTTDIRDVEQGKENENALGTPAYIYAICVTAALAIAQFIRQRR